MCNKKETIVRVRIHNTASLYNEEIATIVHSNCDGTFHVKVWVEGFPEIDLRPSQVEPC